MNAALTDWAAVDRARRLALVDRLVEEALTQLAIGQGNGGLSFHELQAVYDTLERAAAAMQEVMADEPR